MIKNFLRKALKKDSLIVRKTDNEITRFLKQTKIIEERKRYEELMQKEEERKAKGLNDAEKKLLYIDRLENHEEKDYNRSFVNDNLCDFSFLNDKKNYNPLGKRWRPFFIKPIYANQKDLQQKPGYKHWLLRVFGSLLLVKVGY